MLKHPLQLFKSLADQTRLRCLSLLKHNGELCVCELTYALDLPQPKISHHLAILRKVGLVSDRKMGLWIYYQLNPQLPMWISEMLGNSLTSIEQEQPYADDNINLLAMPERPETICST